MSPFNHLQRYFAERTITVEELDKYKIEMVSPAEGAERLGWVGPPKGASGAALLPGADGYCHGVFVIGSTSGFTVTPISFLKGSPKGANDVVLMSGWDWAVPPERVLVAESYVKGIVLARLGLPVIVFNGVTGYSAGEGTVVPRLVRLPWAHQNVQVVLCFDSLNTANETSARNVTAAKFAAGGVFHRHFGCQVLDLALPPPPPGGPEDWGVDDYVATHGLDSLRDHLAVAGELQVNELSAAIGQFNERFALIEELGKIATIRPPFRLYSREAFMLVFGNEWVAVTFPGGPGREPVTKQEQVAKHFLTHRHRRTLDKIVFRPGEDRFIDNNLNIWAGFGVQPDPSGIEEAEDYFANLVREAVPDGGEWLLDALASLVQQPERRLGFYLYFLGQKGTGKGYITGLMKAILGSDRGHAPSITLEGYCNKFNVSKASARMMLIDEMPSPMPKDLMASFEAELKLDSDPNALTRPVERKGSDIVYTDRNCLVVISSNYMPEWPIEWGDRRAACIQFKEEMAVLDAMRPYGTKNFAWWERRFNWRDNGGTAKALAWLLKRDISRFVPEAAPIVSGLKEQIVQHHGDDFKGWMQQVKIDPSILEFQGQNLFEYRYMTAEQLALIYHAGDQEPPTKGKIVSYGRHLYNLQFPNKVFKIGPRGQQKEVRTWKLHGPDEISGQVIHDKYIRPLNVLLSRSPNRGGKY